MIPSGITGTIPSGITGAIPSGITGAIPSGLTGVIPQGITGTIPSGLSAEGGDDTGTQQSISQHADVLDGYLAAISDYDGIDDSHITTMMQELNLGGEDFNLGDTVLQGSDVSGLIGSLDGEHLQGFREQELLNTTSLLGDADVAGTWGVQTALDVINTVGAASVVGVEALEGIASALGADGAGQLGGDLENIAANLDYGEDVDLSGFSIGTLINLDLGDTVLLADDIVGLTNTADVGLLSTLSDTNINEILNVSLGALQTLDTDTLPELLGGLGADLAAQLPDVQIAYLLSAEGLGADYLNSGAASFSEIAASIGGAAEAIFELLADAPDIQALDELAEGASDILAGLF